MKKVIKVQQQQRFIQWIIKVLLKKIIIKVTVQEDIIKEDRIL